MAEIRPFNGVLYRVPDRDLDRVLAPPYDVISPRYRRELEQRDPRNVVRAVLAASEDERGYEAAGETYRRWLEDGVLAADAEPALYLLEQSFASSGRTLRRHGLLARVRAEDPDRGVILPHEQTRKAPREDRFRMLKATRANFSPIFMMTTEGGRFMALVAEHIGLAPALSYTDDAGVGHRLWRVAGGAAIAAFTGLLARAKAYIADGHHRYATALRYRDERGPDGAWTLGYFTPLDAPGLVVLPYHRILSAGPSPEEARRVLEGPFTLQDAAGVTAAADAVSASAAPYAFALAWPGGAALVAESRAEAEPLLPDAAPSLRALDVFMLHHAVLPRVLSVSDHAVSYVHSLAEAEDAVAKGACAFAVLLRGTPVRQIVDVAEARESMPAKSTFFHPKLPSGLVIHPLVI